MSDHAALLCTACGRPIALDALACGRCPHCRVAHGLGADDADLAREILRVRGAAEAERQIWLEETTARTTKFAKMLWGAHPLGFFIRLFTGVGKTHPDYVYMSKVGFDTAFLDIESPLVARRADLEAAQRVAEIARWTAHTRRLFARVHEKIHIGVSHRLWVVLLAGAVIMYSAAGNLEDLWLAKIGCALFYGCTLVFYGVVVLERLRRARNPRAAALARSIDPRLGPEPLGSTAAIVEWLGCRWSDPVDPKSIARGTAAASFHTAVGEGMVMRAVEGDGVPRLIVHVPFVCERPPSVTERRRGDACLASLEARGWRIELDEKIGVRAVLAPVGADVSPSELRPLSDDLRRFCGVPEAFGGTSTLVLFTQAKARLNLVNFHAEKEAYQRRHGG
ncbi:MAG: hypothetical protein R3B09_14835 [Nannocystaceae bacterium]